MCGMLEFRITGSSKPENDNVDLQINKLMIQIDQQEVLVAQK